MSVSVICRQGGETCVPSSSSGTDGRIGIELLVAALNDGLWEALVMMDVGMTCLLQTLL